ncbi:MAG: LexA family transcriptional regulator [Saprospiraceae bacterium]
MLSQNLQYLRRKSGHSQQELADQLEIPRTTWSGYELGKVEPNISMLQKISTFFNQSVDRLLRERIDFDDFEITRDDHLRVLAITMDQDQKQNIELVYAKAEAGYLDGFQDPEYIGELPKMYIPNLPTGSYRAFEIRGDSMLPMPSGSLVISKYVETLSELKDDKTYVIVTEREGIVYKRVHNNKDQKCVTAMSDNEMYPPYTISYPDIREIWRYHAHIVYSDARQQKFDWLQETVMDMQKKLTQMEKKL